LRFKAPPLHDRKNGMEAGQIMKTRHWQRGGRSIDFTELGFGAAPLGNLYRAVSDEHAQEVLEAAWATGMRYFDTAPLYGLGLSESRLMPFLRTKPRDEYVISTKIGRLLKVSTPQERTGIGKFFDTPSRREVYDYTYDGVMRSLEFSLERMGIDHVDILLAHDLDLFTHKSQAVVDAKIDEFMKSGYYALLSLREQGVIKAFGAGVNEWQVCETLLKAGDFDLFLLAGRYTLLEQEALSSFLPLCEERGVGIVLGGPYNSGILATGPKPGAWYNYDPAPKHILERVAKIEAVCKRHKVKLAEAALRFPLHHPQVVSVIPGGANAKEVALNARTMAAKLPRALWKDLKAEGLLRKDAPVPK
jgi:D-threo-aldose 1-dehydrogenase